MKRLVLVALAVSSLSAGVASAQYDPYWDVNRTAVQAANGAKEKAASQQTARESRFKAAPIEVQTNYNPS